MQKFWIVLPVMDNSVVVDKRYMSEQEAKDAAVRASERALGTAFVIMDSQESVTTVVETKYNWDESKV